MVRQCILTRKISFSHICVQSITDFGYKMADVRQAGGQKVFGIIKNLFHGALSIDKEGVGCLFVCFSSGGVAAHTP